MPPLQVKEFPADVYERLRQCAREENRSISQQTLTIIEDYLAMRNGATADPAQQYGGTPSLPPSESYVEKRQRAFARIAALSPLPVSNAAPCAADLLSAIREEEAR
ncbi:MAG: hypothetical protein IJ087_18625, partial [Eggerthellaceae bacterium]|nr:hypothetical protein [Eggerthellaceae bacterium]